MNKIEKFTFATGFTMAFGALAALPAHAVCPVDHDQLTTALVNSVAPNVSNGGFDFNMWATVVDKSGIVCAVTKTGDPDDLTDIWLGSRAIAAQKANTANAFSKTDLAISTANLFTAVQPGGSLFGLQHSNPVSTAVAYAGNENRFGKLNDPMVGQRVGGVNVFGGGLALYDASGNKVGAVGVSGDTSCADHNVAWRVRDALLLDYVPGGPGGAFGGTVADNIVYDIATGLGGHATSASGFGHPECGFSEVTVNGQILIDHPLSVLNP